MTIIDPVNFDFYERLWSDAGHRHDYPNINTVRCEKWFFRPTHSGGGRLLDFGHGCGQEAAYFARLGYRVCGVEISQNAHNLLLAQLQGPFADVADRIELRLLSDKDDRLPFDDASFDYISSTQVVYHLPDEQALLTLVKEWHRILKPGGRLMFSTIGPGNSLVTAGRPLRQYEHLSVHEYVNPHRINNRYEVLRSLYIESEEAIRFLCRPFDIVEVGWYSNHYCGIDGFHWQVLAQKPISGDANAV
jgi:SAM-dependent methyltransferase